MFLIRSGAIAGFEALVSALGGNPVTLMAAAGFTPAQLRNPNTYVSYSKLAELLEITAETCCAPLFGLSLAERQTSSVLGDVSVTAARQPTLREALEAVNKYLYLHARGAHVEARPRGDDLQLELEISISSPRGLNQLLQLSVGQLANFLAEVLTLQRPTFPLMLRQVAPPGAATATPDLSRVRFAARANGVRIPAHWLERRLQPDDSALRDHLHAQIQQLQERYPDSLEDQIRDVMGQMLPSGECRIERVASTLGLHARVVQKRLQRLGTSYNQLLRETRMEIAEQHLRHRSMAITDLALHLGYADVSVFSRNFRHWTGLSPRNWQQAHATP
jgi:AraC-like DNA-binding protein